MGEKYFSNEIVGFLHPALALSPKQYLVDEKVRVEQIARKIVAVIL